MRTPGPWDVDLSVTSYAAAVRYNYIGGRHTVAYVEGPGLGRGNEGRRQTGIDNARLIAASPDLLDACKAIVDGNTATATEMARKAIAKALGHCAP